MNARPAASRGAMRSTIRSLRRSSRRKQPPENVSLIRPISFLQRALPTYDRLPRCPSPCRVRVPPDGWHPSRRSSLDTRLLLPHSVDSLKSETGRRSTDSLRNNNIVSIIAGSGVAAGNIFAFRNSPIRTGIDSFVSLTNAPKAKHRPPSPAPAYNSQRRTVELPEIFSFCEGVGKLFLSIFAMSLFLMQGSKYSEAVGQSTRILRSVQRVVCAAPVFYEVEPLLS
jgi:hypothetical protein